MKETIKLPEEKVLQKISEVRAVVNRPSPQAIDLYDQTIANVGSEACFMAETVVGSIASLRRKLNITIILHRAFAILSICTIIAAGILWSIWILLIGIGLLVTTMYIISHRQTTMNIEMAARTEVFWEMMNFDQDFRTQVLEFVKSNMGNVAAENLQSFLPDTK